MWKVYEQVSRDQSFHYNIWTELANHISAMQV